MIYHKPSGYTSNYPRLVPERKAALVKALRSGDFEQGYGSLHRVSVEDSNDTGRFCCLGVAYKVCPMPGTMAITSDYDNFGHDVVYNGNAGVWGVEQAEYMFGDAYNGALNMTNPAFFTITYEGGFGDEITAVHANDSFNLTFDQIADLFDYFL